MRITPYLLFILFVLIILNITNIFYLNIFTHSLPQGVYLRIKGVPQRNSYAATCLSPEIARYGIDRGYLADGSCGTGTVLVLKMIKGVPGDRFLFQNGFLKLNGYSYPIVDHDSSGRRLKVFYAQGEGVLDKGQYILLSNFVKNSWDSRYWGPVGIQFLLKPLWIFDYTNKKL